MVHKGNKSILFVTYHFPPDASVGAKRVTKLARFLIKNGWDVGVLTVKDKYYSHRDESVSIEGITIYRTPMFESIRFLFGRIKNVFKRSRGLLERGEIRGDDRSLLSERQTVRDQEGQRENVLSRIERIILSLVWCPDDRQGWIPFAVAKCLLLSRKYDLIYSSCPAYSVNLIPLFTSFFTRKFNWVAEFRDPWTKRSKPYFFASRFSNWLEERWEAMVMKRSREVVVVNEAIKGDFIERYPQYKNKINVFYNGYDEDELFGLTCDILGGESKKVTILHAGSLYHGRDPRLILRPIAELIHEDMLKRDEIEVRFLGDDIYDGKPVIDFAEEHRISDIVRCLGHLPHKQCLKEINDANVLLLFNINQPLQVPAKLYEYFAFRKRILSISTGGMTDELIERAGIGVSVKPDDYEAIKDVIVRLISDARPVVDEEEIKRFRTSSIFETLILKLENLIN